MPSPNGPNPGNIPDMSLGERSEKPAPAQPLPEVSTSYTPQPEPVKTPSSAESSAPPDWQEGDRVLAPWEPVFLYAGTIKQIKIDEAQGDQALIQFDDGDAGWVFLFSLCPLEVKNGQKVLSRRNMGPHFSRPRFWK